MKNINAIAAVSKNWVIGDTDLNGLPWPSQKEDFAWFREKTLNKKVLFGRTTFEGMPPIKKRQIYVMSSSLVSHVEQLVNNDENLIRETKKDNGYTVVKKIEDIKIEKDEELWICGGAKIYKQFIPNCEKLYLTIFDFKVDTEGTIYFPFTKTELDELFNTKQLIKNIQNGSIWEFSNK